MRKWLSLALLFLVLLIGSVYAFIPNKMRIHEETIVLTNTNGFNRTITDHQRWKQWWPGEMDTVQNDKAPYRLVFNKNHYTFLESSATFQTIQIHQGDDTVLSQLVFVPLNKDTISIQWEAANITSFSPLKRYSRYRHLNGLEKDWQVILIKLKEYFSSASNIYGLAIQKEKVKDSILITTIINTRLPPTTDTIYSLIDELKTFAKKRGANQRGLPMLNISQVNTVDAGASYRTQVALPVDRELPVEGRIQYRWMFGGGKILAAEVKGGPATIANAFLQLENYVADHNLVAPAIPFQSLVTDRRAITDTNQWVTKVYWPVM